MSYYLGVDLGSTTTKAIIINEEQEVIGRGLTNTRSNYSVACEVAQKEAETNARFSFLMKTLKKYPELNSMTDDLFDKIELNFRYEQHLFKLGRLKELCLNYLINTSFAGGRGDIEWVLREIFKEMEKGAYSIYQETGQDRSRFFRDIVGSEYMALVEKNSAKYKVDFESLMSLYDKSIIHVENQVLEIDFEENMKRAAERTLKSHPEREKIAPLLIKAANEVAGEKLEIVSMSGTGYGRQQLPFPKEKIRSEILCHGLGAHYMFPKTRTVLDIGGQDTKGIQVDENGIVTNFQMNDRCAAGCGRYLGYIADELSIGLHQLGPLSLQATKVVRVNSTCTVFAGAELRDMLSLGEKRENVLAGLHRSIILRVMSILARSGGVKNEFTFTGGVAKNQAVVKALKEITFQNYGELTINISPDSIYTGAIGAALFAKRG